MRIHHLQHVPFEGLGYMEPVLRQKGHTLTATHLYNGQRLPPVEDFDWLIVMGGPMGVSDEDQYPWLRAEKAFVKEAIAAGKIVLGICLGAQLIADILGGRVYKNQHREIGWFNIKWAPEAAESILAEAVPGEAEVFHWHGDTFEIPEGARRLASSAACVNQGFIKSDRIVGLQFHLETTKQSAAALMENCRDELDSSRYVQTEAEMLADDTRFTKINGIMLAVIEALETRGSG